MELINERVTKVNIRTGEILEEHHGDAISIIPGKRKKAKGFVIVFTEEFAKLKSYLYSKGFYSSMLLVDYFISKLDMDTGTVQFNAKQFAEYAHCTLGTAYDALKKLETLTNEHGMPQGIIRQVKDYGSLKVYELSPYIGWKGREALRLKTIRNKDRITAHPTKKNLLPDM